MAGTPRPLAPEETGDRLRARFGDDISEVVEQHGHTVVTVVVDRYHDLCRFLRDQPALVCLRLRWRL